jgi:hypothetical protein
MRRAPCLLLAAACLAVSHSAVGASPRRASLATFAGYWWGHTRGLRIMRDGHAAESIFSGCCDRVINVDFRLSRPRGTSQAAAAIATVTAVWVRDRSAFTAAHPAPQVGETRTIRLRDGVISESLTGASYCAPRVDKCGA